MQIDQNCFLQSEMTIVIVSDLGEPTDCDFGAVLEEARHGLFGEPRPHEIRDNKIFALI